MLKEMGQVAVECLKHPTRSSYWIPYEERYLCPESQQKYPSVPLEQRDA